MKPLEYFILNETGPNTYGHLVLTFIMLYYNANSKPRSPRTHSPFKGWTVIPFSKTCGSVLIFICLRLFFFKLLEFVQFEPIGMRKSLPGFEPSHKNDGKKCVCKRPNTAENSTSNMMKIS